MRQLLTVQIECSQRDYPPPPGCPEWMGLKIAGVIVNMGDKAKEKSNLKIRDKVALLGGGGYAVIGKVVLKVK